MSRLTRIVRTQIVIGAIALLIAGWTHGRAAIDLVVGTSVVTAAAIQNNFCLYIKGGLLGAQSCALNITGYLNSSQLTSARAGVNTVNVASAISQMITDCEGASSVEACAYYFPASYYYDATCNHALTKPFKLYGDGSRGINKSGAIASPGNISTIACAANSVPVFSSLSYVGTVRDLAIIPVGFTATIGSSALLLDGVTGVERVDVYSNYFGAFYVAVDKRVGQYDTIANNVIEDAIYYGIRIRNVVLPDGGGCWVRDNGINMAPLAEAGISYESGGGCTLNGNNIISQTLTPIVDGIRVDFTGVVSQQVIITGNSVDFVSGYALNAIRGLGWSNIANNYWGCGRTDMTACVYADGMHFSNFGPNTFKNGDNVKSYLINGSQWVTLQASPMQGLPVEWTGGSGIFYNGVDLTQFVPSQNLTISTFDPRTPGLAAVAVDTSNNAHCTEFQVNATVIVSSVEFVIGASSGNISIGVLDRASSQWIATTGSFASPGTGIRGRALTDSITLAAGHKYYGCFAADNTSVTFLAATQVYATSSIDTLNTYSDSMFPIPASGSLANSHIGLKAPILSFY